MPVLVEVIVRVFAPVTMVPNVMFTVAAEILLCRMIPVAAVVLLTVRMLNVVAPLIFVL